MMSLPLPFPKLVRLTWKEAADDDLLGLAAQMAYYFFLALFPAILFLIAIASFFPLWNVTDDLARSLGPFVSPQIVELIQDQMRRIAERQDGGILTLGVAMALWSSSAAMVSIVGALNKAYDLDETRPWWKVRLTAITLTIAVALFVLVALSLVIAGPALAASLGDRMSAPALQAWSIVRWPIAFALVVMAVGLTYYFAPDADQDWVWITPGAVLATVLWLLISIVFKTYIANFTDYNGTYGSVGGVIVLLLWFYVSSLAILVGAEFNAELEHASPYGKAPGQKSKAGRPMIGVRARRAFEAQQRLLYPGLMRASTD
jgi:membrane protein